MPGDNSAAAVFFAVAVELFVVAVGVCDETADFADAFFAVFVGAGVVAVLFDGVLVRDLAGLIRVVLRDKKRCVVRVRELRTLCANTGSLDLLPGVITGANERTTLHMFEAETHAGLVQPTEVFRCDIPVKRNMSV